MTKTKQTDKTGQTIALTGATGFLGGHLLDVLVNTGQTVRALTRRPQPERDGVVWISGDLDDTDALEELCRDADCIIHAGAVVKALSRDGFFNVNVRGTKNILAAAKKTGPSRFLLISSLAARQPQLSHYAASKAASEMAVSSGHWPFKWTIIRPPAIYGPGDMEILKLFKALNLGILPVPGSRKNRFSMIHVKDMAQAIARISQGGFGGQVLEVDDGQAGGYRMTDIAAALAGKNKLPKLITVPYPVLAGIGAFNGLIAKVTRRPHIFTAPKARELAHPDWSARSARKPHLDNWSPEYDINRGLEDTLNWYRDNGYLS